MAGLHELSDEELIRRAVTSAGHGSHKGAPMWSEVGAVFGLGSGYSSDLCRRFGVDPDAIPVQGVHPCDDCPCNGEDDE